MTPDEEQPGICTRSLGQIQIVPSDFQIAIQPYKGFFVPNRWFFFFLNCEIGTFFVKSPPPLWRQCSINEKANCLQSNTALGQNLEFTQVPCSWANLLNLLRSQFLTLHMGTVYTIMGAARSQRLAKFIHYTLIGQHYIQQSLKTENVFHP